MWAAIGIYTGRETNVFWRRGANGLQRLGEQTMDERDAVWLGATAIHSVTDPLDRLTGALHVYGGDFFGTPRSDWDEETLSSEERRGGKEGGSTCRFRWSPFH